MPDRKNIKKRSYSIITYILTFMILITYPSLSNGAKYLKPSKEICNIVNEAPLSPPVFSQNHKMFIVGKRPSTTTLAELAQPVFQLAGIRINRYTKCKVRSIFYNNFTIYYFSSSSSDTDNKQSIKSVKLILPHDGRFGAPTWMTDNRTIVFSNTTNTGVE